MQMHHPLSVRSRVGGHVGRSQSLAIVPEIYVDTCLHFFWINTEKWNCRSQAGVRALSGAHPATNAAISHTTWLVTFRTARGHLPV